MDRPGDEARAGDVLLACEDLHKQFTLRGQPIKVLQGASLSVSRGEILAIRGKTGVGKSTLLGLLAGLDRPDCGTVTLEGRSLDRLSDHEVALLRRHKMGIVFQSFNLLPAWTALQNVEAALLHTGMPREQRQQRATEVLTNLGLGDRLENLPSELSVGQQQRVAIARALVNQPMLIFADEPTGDVDPATGEEIISYLTAPVKGQAVTLIVATHGIFPLEAADRVLELRDGVLHAT
jgi:putative ABC transport system ATP-binding protein